eukprot:TRINITY_DN30550_c0_g1_i1.p1 TRINITY_DN30550_c0_g1~~TRINITY_DN30550_c0_g1_i1.p1  ORF type:complete len:1390 (-),score=196.92 TRINITY_DN30550_c0_g1_i1:177-4346(-)
MDLQVRQIQTHQFSILRNRGRPRSAELSNSGNQGVDRSPTSGTHIAERPLEKESQDSDHGDEPKHDADSEREKTRQTLTFHAAGPAPNRRGQHLPPEGPARMAGVLMSPSQCSKLQRQKRVALQRWNTSQLEDPHRQQKPLEPAYWKARGGTRDPESQPKRYSSDDLAEAALRGDLVLLKKQIAAEVSVNTPIRVTGDDEYLTLLHILACKPQVPNGISVMIELIKLKANPNARSSMGSTPLMFACYHKHVDAVEVLMQRGADISPVDDTGVSATRHAVIVHSKAKSLVGGQQHDLDPLLQKRAKSDHAVGFTVQEAKQRSLAILDHLYAFDVDLDFGGLVSPIIEAIRQDHIEGMLKLLSFRAKADGMVDAAQGRGIDFVQALIDSQADPFAVDEAGQDCIEVSLKRGNQEVVDAIREYTNSLIQSRDALLYNRNKDALALPGAAPAFSMSFAKGASAEIDSDDNEDGIGDAVQSALKRGATKMLSHWMFQTVTSTNVFLALYLPDVWTVMEIVGGLDYCLAGIFFVFLIEIMVQWVGNGSTYTRSFNFWVDVVGLLSVPIESHWVKSFFMSMFDVEVVGLVRITKFVKLGARAGRISRIVKLMRFLPGLKETKADMQDQSTAKMISRSLNNVLSTRVAGLLVLTVVMIPLTEFWSYPQLDYAANMYVHLIESHVRGNNTDGVFTAIRWMDDFHANFDYFPYRVALNFVNGTQNNVDVAGRTAPIRKEDVVVITGGRGAVVTTYYNFHAPNLLESMMSIALVSTIIAVMFISSDMVFKTVSKVVLKPIRELLSLVKDVADDICEIIEKMAIYFVKNHVENTDGRQDTDAVETNKEIKLLLRVFKKLQVLNQVTMAEAPIDEFEKLGKAQQALLVDYTTEVARRHMTVIERDESQLHGERAEQAAISAGVSEELFEVGLTLTEINDWDIKMLELSRLQVMSIARVCLLQYDTAKGAGKNEEKINLRNYKCHINFLTELAACYGDPHMVPYHNFTHAVDVALSVRNMFTQIEGERIFNMHERFALLVSALAHDAGHFGFTNSYLMQTKHPLAMTYNDSSILQKMHCARLFTVMRNPMNNIMKHLDHETYMDVRHICVEAILHTDFARHFAGLWKLQAIYDRRKVMFNHIYEAHVEERADQIPDEARDEWADYLWKTEVKYCLRNLFVHFADLGGAHKDWPICEAWGLRMFQEFFSQGDKEREQRLQVQPLNDRARTNIPCLQLSFMKLFVAPLTTIVARMFPPLIFLEDNVWDNVDKWFEKWSETNPDPSEFAQVSLIISRMNLKGKTDPCNLLDLACHDTTEENKDSEDDLPPTLGKSRTVDVLRETEKDPRDTVISKSVQVTSRAHIRNSNGRATARSTTMQGMLSTKPQGIDQSLEFGRMNSLERPE